MNVRSSTFMEPLEVILAHLPALSAISAILPLVLYRLQYAGKLHAFQREDLRHFGKIDRAFNIGIAKTGLSIPFTTPDRPAARLPAST